MTLFQQELERSLGKKLVLQINDNHSTMLSVKWEADVTRVSLHRMFLQAPCNVMDALACYIRREQNTLGPEVHEYIDSNLPNEDYSSILRQKKLETSGRIYDLQVLYDKINAEYFQKALSLSITWYGLGERLSGMRVNLGLYDIALKLIKIHRLLDNSCVPRYVVEYVLYHEMLHSICPPMKEGKGRRSIHTKEFLERERQYHYFHCAKQWIEDNRHQLFK